jgi:hypothetical protein
MDTADSRRYARNDDIASRYDPPRYWLGNVILSDQSESENTKSKTLLSSLSSGALHPSKNDSAVSQQGRLYFPGFLSLPHRKEAKSKGNGYRGCPARGGKRSGQCSRKLASKSCGRNERRAPLRTLPGGKLGPPSRPPSLTRSFLSLSPPKRRRPGGNEKLLRSVTWEGGRRGGGGNGRPLSTTRRLAARPSDENPRGNFAERTSISCVQWDIGYKEGIKRRGREWWRYCRSDESTPVPRLCLIPLLTRRDHRSLVCWRNLRDYPSSPLRHFSIYPYRQCLFLPCAFAFPLALILTLSIAL